MSALDVDSARSGRTGVADVVNGSGRTTEQTAAIVAELLDRESFALAVRVESKVATGLLKRFADSRYDARARAFAAGKRPRTGRSCAVVHVAPTDLACADEAAFCLDALGNDVVRIAGLRLGDLASVAASAATLAACDAIVVVAGMDAGLASALAGLLRGVVIAVPASAPNAAGFGGLAPLLAMLTGATPGVAVVNVDDAMGAAVTAHKIAARAAQPQGAN